MDSATREYVYTRHDNKRFYLRLEKSVGSKYHIWAKLLSAKEHPPAKAVNIDCSTIAFPEQKNGRKVKAYIELEPKVLVERDEFYRKVEFENGTEENARKQSPCPVYELQQDLYRRSAAAGLRGGHHQQKGDLQAASNAQYY